MMWDQVMKRVMAQLENNATIVAINGTTIRRAGADDQAVPCLEWHLIADTEDELWTPMVVQFDQWVRFPADLITIERELRGLYHQELPVIFNGEFPMFMSWQDGTTLQTPDRSNFYGRAMRFKFTPLRQRLALPQLGL
jgi:hypothetical protein